MVCRVLSPLKPLFFSPQNHQGLFCSNPAPARHSVGKDRPLTHAWLQLVAQRLGDSMLIALEVAVEFWLALSWTPQAQWLAGSGSSSALHDEVSPSAALCVQLNNMQRRYTCCSQKLHTNTAFTSMLPAHSKPLPAQRPSGVAFRSYYESLRSPGHTQSRVVQANCLPLTSDAYAMLCDCIMLQAECPIERQCCLNQ